MEIALIKIIGAVVVLGGALLGFLWFMTQLWFVIMGARALSKYVGEDDPPKRRRHGTPVSEWRGRTSRASAGYGRPLRLIKGGRDEV